MPQVKSIDLTLTPVEFAYLSGFLNEQSKHISTGYFKSIHEKVIAIGERLDLDFSDTREQYNLDRNNGMTD